MFRLLHSRWSDINGLPVVSLHETPIYGVDSVVKRVADIALATIGILVTLIPMLIIAAFIKLTSKGPHSLQTKTLWVGRKRNFGLEVPFNERD